jgi:hypothetical protein
LDAQPLETLFSLWSAWPSCGLAWLPGGRRRQALAEHLETKVLPAAQAYAELMAKAQAEGKAIGLAGGLIGQRAVVRNGYLPGRRVLTAVGPVEVRVLGCEIATSEAEVNWRCFLESLWARGLKGVKLIVADDHAGLKAARSALAALSVPSAAERHSVRHPAGGPKDRRRPIARHLQRARQDGSRTAPEDRSGNLAQGASEACRGGRKRDPGKPYGLRLPGRSSYPLARDQRPGALSAGNCGDARG